MSALSIILDIVLILISIVLIVAVLMQQGQREGLGAIAGGADTFFGKGKAKGTLQAYLCDVRAYKNEPHSFGPIMLAMVEAHRNGLKEIEWKEEMFSHVKVYR